MNNIRNKDLLLLVGNHIRGIRTKKKMTLEELAYASDMELSQVYRIEKGKVNVTISSLYNLCLGLEIPLNELLKDIDISSLQ